MAVKKPSHEIRLLVGDKVYTGKGQNTLSALKQMKEPTDIKSVVRIEAVIDGKLSRFPITLFRYKVQRLFANDWEMELFAKRLDTLR